MPTILIFDSGVGGLSIYEHVKALLPNANYLLVCDNHAFPYGEKSEEELNQRVLDVMQNLVRQFDPDIAVVACNTASTVVLPLLRQRLSLPVVGVVPAIKPSVSLSKTKTIGLLATPGTIRRDYTLCLISEFASDCTMIPVGSVKLVELCETKLYTDALDLIALEQELQPILNNSRCDTLVLACTHFPLIATEIRSVFEKHNQGMLLIDSGQGIARRVEYLLSQSHDLVSEDESSKEPAKRRVLFTEAIDEGTGFTKKLRDSFGLQAGGVLELT